MLSPDVSSAAGHQVTIPANSVDHPFSYECKDVTQGAYVGNNTVTFDYSDDSHEYPDADDKDSHTQAVAVTGDPTPTNETVTITDLLDGSNVTGGTAADEVRLDDGQRDDRQHAAHQLRRDHRAPPRTRARPTRTWSPSTRPSSPTTTPSRCARRAWTKSVVADYGLKAAVEPDQGRRQDVRRGRARRGKRPSPTR